MLTKQFLESNKKIIKGKIKERGPGYVIGKILKKLITLEILIIYPVVFFLCVIIRLVRPLFFIRFGSLYSEKIGPFSSRPELNLCEQEHGIQPKGTFNIYNTGFSSFTCNRQLLNMWKRVLRVYPRSKYFWNIMRSFSFGKDHVIDTTKTSRDIHGLLEKSPVHLTFTKEEIFRAKQELLRMGINEKDKYVLIINRGQRYHIEGLPTLKNRNFDYHTFRNCSINDFIPMAEMLVLKGSTVIRMGHKVSDYMNTKNPKIIEYEKRGFRTDLLDIYLAANCRYIVGSDTGYSTVSGWNFRRPIVYVNFSCFEYIEPWLSSWLFIYKKHWIKSEKRFMKVKELFDSGVSRFFRTDQYEKNGIEVINNSPKEIQDVVDEQEQRLNGTWKENDEDNELQKIFWAHFKHSKYHGVIRSRIGANFLRENKNLIY